MTICCFPTSLFFFKKSCARSHFMHRNSAQVIRKFLEEEFKMSPSYLQKELPYLHVERATRMLCSRDMGQTW